MKNEWIDSKYKLPPECESILVIQRYYAEQNLEKFMISIAYFSDKEWSIEGGYFSIESDKVVGWQYLPEMPEIIELKNEISRLKYDIFIQKLCRGNLKGV